MLLPTSAGSAEAVACFVMCWARARAEGMVQVLLEVRESNDAAYRLYRQEGFREIGRRKGYYPAASGREDARVMALSLDSCSLPGACPL